MSNIEKIRQEIDMYIKSFELNGGIYDSYEAGELSAYKEILDFLDSLPDEKPSEDLEEAARHSEILTYPMPEDGDIEKVMKVQEARIFHEIGFIAGAEWAMNHREEKK